MYTRPGMGVVLKMQQMEHTLFYSLQSPPEALWIPYLRNYLYPPLALICTLVTVYNTNPVRRSPPRRPPPCTPAGSSFARPAPSPPPPSVTLSYALTLSSTPSARRRTGRPWPPRPYPGSACRRGRSWRGTPTRRRRTGAGSSSCTIPPTSGSTISPVLANQRSKGNDIMKKKKFAEGNK